MTRRLVAALAVVAVAAAAPAVLRRAPPHPEPVAVADAAPFTPGAGAPLAAALLAGGTLELNRASAADLQALPGIGPERARRIVAYRASVGPFRSVDDLRRISGIGPKTLERVRPFLRVD